MGFGEGGIRIHVPVTRQHAFEARPLRPLRYLSVRNRREADPRLYRTGGGRLSSSAATVRLKPDTTCDGEFAARIPILDSYTRRALKNSCITPRHASSPT